MATRPKKLIEGSSLNMTQTLSCREVNRKNTESPQVPAKRVNKATTDSKPIQQIYVQA